MTFQNSKRPYCLADIEPTIAIAEAARWERETAVATPTAKPMSYDLMRQARIMRSEYQRELLRRFAALILSWLVGPRTAHVASKAQRQTTR